MSVSCATDGSTLGQFPPRALAVPGIGHIPPVVQVGEIAPNTGHDGAPLFHGGRGRVTPNRREQLLRKSKPKDRK